MAEHQGWIALDIDGTITDQLHHIPIPVCSYLSQLHQQGWEIIFITGRTFSFAHSVLKAMPFPFYFAVQNGADILHMPSKTLVSQSYIDGSILRDLENFDNLLLFSGYEKGDFCYYRPQKITPDSFEHLEKIRALSPEPWRPVENFDFALTQAFPLIKFFGLQAPIQEIYYQLKGCSAIPIRDPLGEDIYLILVTDLKATKGQALDRAIQKKGMRGKVIAAGDDWNDLSMLLYADVGIVMETAPIEMHQHGKIIGKPASQLGIIEALEKAIDV